MTKKSDFNMLKNLGIIPRYYEDKEQNVKVRCPFHDDTAASLIIDYDNINDKAPHYSSSRCHACQQGVSNTNISKYWLQTFTKLDSDDSKNWSWARDIFHTKIIDNFFKDKPNNEEKSDLTPLGLERSYNYEDVKAKVLEIFDLDLLNKHNTTWEEQLKYLVKMKEIGVDRQNPAAPWNLVFKVGFGPDYALGGVRYQPQVPERKVMMYPGTPTGIMMPFFLGEESGEVNEQNIYDSNLIANKRNTIFIVEGQKDMLALWLVGIPALTITGGANAVAKVPELFQDKNVYIIYDNDKMGREGASKLGKQLAEFAATVKVGLGVYNGLEEKEDAFDFFFKYGHTKREFAERMSNPDNFIVYDKERIALEKRKAEAERKSQEYQESIEKIKKKASEVELPFNDIFSAQVHSLFKFDARLDKINPNVSHSIYLRPLIEIRDHRTYDKQTQFNINADLLNLEEKIKELNKYYKQLYGCDTHVVKYDFKEIKTKSGEIQKLITNFRIERILGEQDFDIIEQILLGRNGKGSEEANAYKRAGAFKNVSKAITDFIRNTNKKFKRASGPTEEGEEPESLVGRAFSNEGSVTVTSGTFNKQYMMDFTTAIVYEDKTHTQLSVESHSDNDEDEIGTYNKTYKVLLPSHLLTANTKIGDRVTIYGGKIKDEKNNMPFILSWHFDRRDPIDEFELSESVIQSLNKFRFKGDTVEELRKHQLEQYDLWMWHSEAEYTTKMWEAVELTFASVARSSRLATDGTPETFKSALDVAIVGDSRIGKSESVKRAKKMYRVGTKVEMLNASPIGIIGGSDTAKNNQITLGTLPLNHRGLVEFDELSAISDVERRDDLFKRLHVARQEGTALIDRVSGKVAAPADVRLISTSNPVGRIGGAASSNPSMASFKGSSYWTVLDRLLPSLPVKARFSFAYFPTAEEFALETQEADSPNSRHAIKARIQSKGLVPLDRQDYLNKINWIWSRRPEQSLITSEIDEYIRQEVKDKIRPQLFVHNAEEIGIYTDGTTTAHITNMAIAIAASTFSTDETLEKVIVKEVHVDYVIRLLLSMYSKETGIPEMLDNMRKASNYDTTELDLLFGTKPYIMSKFFKNKALTLHEDNDLIMRAHMYDLYDQLYKFSTDGGEGASTNISWAHVESYFDMIVGRWNEIIMDTSDPSRQLFANIGNEQVIRNTKELTGAWKQLMSKLGIIKERANQKQFFFLQAKFGLLWQAMKDRYEEMYDTETHEPL